MTAPLPIGATEYTQKVTNVMLQLTVNAARQTIHDQPESTGFQIQCVLTFIFKIAKSHHQNC